MADYTLSPNMSMPVPTVSEAPGPGWATNLDASLSIIDSHNHSSGQGVAINPSGLDINSDLPYNNNNATSVRSVNFYAQSATISLPTDIGCLYVAGVDLYYNDENGNVIRITQSGSVTGSSGTITGLPSGTASASYSAGTFTFQSATNTPAAMNVGPLTFAQSVANSKNITLNANSGQAANYSITFPAALPAALNYLTLDNTGALSFNNSGITGSGANVLATSPSITTPSISGGSISSATLVTPTVSGLLTVSASGIAFTSGTLTDYVQSTWSPSYTNATNVGSISNTGSARYQRIGTQVYCTIRLNFTTSNTNWSFNFSLPVAPTNNFNTATDPSALTAVFPFGASTNTINIAEQNGAKTVLVSGSLNTGVFNINLFLTYDINN